MSIKGLSTVAQPKSKYFIQNRSKNKNIRFVELKMKTICYKIEIKQKYKVKVCQLFLYKSLQVI